MNPCLQMTHYIVSRGISAFCIREVTFPACPRVKFWRPSLDEWNPSRRLLTELSVLTTVIAVGTIQSIHLWDNEWIDLFAKTIKQAHLEQQKLVCDNWSMFHPSKRLYLKDPCWKQHRCISDYEFIAHLFIACSVKTLAEFSECPDHCIVSIQNYSSWNPAISACSLELSNSDLSHRRRWAAEFHLTGIAVRQSRSYCSFGS